MINHIWCRLLHFQFGVKGDTLPFVGVPRIGNNDPFISFSTPQGRRISANVFYLIGRDENFAEWASSDIMFTSYGVTARPTDKLRLNATYSLQSFNRRSDGSIVGNIRLPRLNALEKWMITLLVIVLLSFLSTVPRKSGAHLYQGVVHLLEGYLTPFAGYLLARSQAWSERDIRRLLQWLAALAVYLTLAGALQYFLGVYFFSPTYLGVGEKTDRAVSGFGSPVEFGHVMASLTLLCLFLHTITRDAALRALIIVAATAAACGIALSLTRACWAGALVSLGYVFWKDTKVRGVLAVGALAAVIVLAVALPLVMRTEVFEQRLAELTPIYNRLALWSTAANMIAHNPVFGVGFGFRTFNDEKRDYLISFGPSALGQYALEPGVPHNEFLHVFAMMGMVGFGAYVLVYLNAWRIARDRRREAGDGAYVRARLATYVQAILLIFIVGGMVSEMWTYRYLLTLLFFLVGILASPGQTDGGSGTGNR